MTPAIPEIFGYDYGTENSATSPLTEEELSQLEQTVGWSPEDAKTLQRHAELFRQHAEAMVDSWRTVIGAQPHLSHWFVAPDGKPDDAYKARVKRRFVQWVVDVAQGRSTGPGWTIKRKLVCATRPQKRTSQITHTHLRSYRCGISWVLFPWSFPYASSFPAQSTMKTN